MILEWDIQEALMGVMVCCSHTFGHTVYIIEICGKQNRVNTIQHPYILLVFITIYLVTVHGHTRFLGNIKDKINFVIIVHTMIGRCWTDSGRNYIIFTFLFILLFILLV